jgi:hypothetical protein
LDVTTVALFRLIAGYVRYGARHWGHALMPCVCRNELRIIEQRKVDLVAHRGNVGLVEEEPGGMAPTLTELGLLLWEGQDVIGSLAYGAQDGPALGREGLGELLGEVRGRQRHDAYLGGEGPESSRLHGGQ